MAIDPLKLISNNACINSLWFGFGLKSTQKLVYEHSLYDISSYNITSIVFVKYMTYLDLKFRFMFSETSVIVVVLYLGFKLLYNYNECSPFKRNNDKSNYFILACNDASDQILITDLVL